MRGAADLTTWRRSEEFREDPTPIVVMDRELVIRAVNPAHEQATGHGLAAVESRHVFEAYPANPEDPEARDGRATLEASFDRVLREGRPHNLVIQRYDVPDPLDPERFVRRTWVPVTVPVWGPDAQVGVACRAVVVDLPARAEAVLRTFRDALRDAAGSEDADAMEMVEVLCWGLGEYAAAAREIGQLREALVSRASIDQAKGVLMARHHVDPDEAFQMLVRLSNESNVRLAEVARALVYQVQAQGR